MNIEDLEKLKYPIGKLIIQQNYWPDEIKGMVGIIASYPAKYQALTASLTKEELAKTYRDGSMTIQQLVHHVADMHVLAYIRFKMALTADHPEAPVVEIDAWTLTPENTDSIEVSLNLLALIHAKWVLLLEKLPFETFESHGFYHPTRQLNFNLAQALQLSTWHIQHHYEHIKIALNT